MWRITSPLGIRWNMRFSTPEAAWNRLTASRPPHASRELYRKKLLLDGWKVENLKRSIPALETGRERRV